MRSFRHEIYKFVLYSRQICHGIENYDQFEDRLTALRFRCAAGGFADPRIHAMLG